MSHMVRWPSPTVWRGDVAIRALRPLATRLVGRLRPQWVRNRLTPALLDVETFRPPTIMAEPPGRRPLVLAPHPDDETIGCGGAICAWRHAGAPVAVAFLADGGRGDPELRAMPTGSAAARARRAALIATRREEAEAALALLGVAEAHYLGGTDGALKAEPSVVRALRRLLESVRADTVALPFLTDRHPDHVATTGILLAAMKDLRQPPQTILGYEVWAPLPVTDVLDITAYKPTKDAALACYASQLRTIDYLAATTGLARYRAVSGLLPGAYAEAFHRLDPARLRELWQRIQL